MAFGLFIATSWEDKQDSAQKLEVEELIKQRVKTDWHGLSGQARETDR